jgi:hypothetical protein
MVSFSSQFSKRDMLKGVVAFGSVILISGTGGAIHSIFWHNDFGTPRSHGCDNVRPVNTKWIFRWTNPVVLSDPGDITI